MKKIIDSRKLLGATAKSDLQELAKLYKGLMKQHHPDRFQDETERAAAEQLSTKIIEAYKFLESIHPETHAANAADFETTVATNIANWHYQHQTLHLTFGDGSVYEYYSVPSNVYNKFVATNGQPRFARRHIIGTYAGRKVSGPKPKE
ncbi:MAG: KTSC domain-containing protein [Flavobacteriales bacterium]|nr:KTSC domain-containing protein [Flavobacteriales bacterium]